LQESRHQVLLHLIDPSSIIDFVEVNMSPEWSAAYSKVSNLIRSECKMLHMNDNS
jgi:hypothetical protein